ncbi:hypothetical protein [Neptunicella sp.]|uniref:hypothetical protein n=1 Tax=Neptunicella sp. TaxID=2125986 RepID=UPI003F690296
MKKPLLKHHKALFVMLILVCAYLFFDTPVGKPGQMYAAVISTNNSTSPPTTTFALQNGIEVTFDNVQFKQGQKIKLWVKQTRFSRQRTFSLTPEFSVYTKAKESF